MVSVLGLDADAFPPTCAASPDRQQPKREGKQRGKKSRTRFSNRGEGTLQWSRLQAGLERRTGPLDGVRGVVSASFHSWPGVGSN